MQSYKLHAEYLKILEISIYQMLIASKNHLDHLSQTIKKMWDLKKEFC